ncbi:hypothetical protein MTO96_012688 [Rhipicephalus appendiculatus]
MWFPTSPSVAANKTFHGKSRPYAGAKKTPEDLPTKTEHERSTQIALVDPRELLSLPANISVVPPVMPGPQYELHGSDAVSAGTVTVKGSSEELSTAFPEVLASSSTSSVTSSDVGGNRGSMELTSPAPQRRTGARETVSDRQATFIRKKAPLYASHSPGTGFFLEAKLTKYPRRSAQNVPTTKAPEQDQDRQTSSATPVQPSKDTVSALPQIQSTTATPTSYELPLSTTRRAEHTSAVTLKTQFPVAEQSSGDISSSDEPRPEGPSGKASEQTTESYEQPTVRKQLGAHGAETKPSPR